MSAIKLPVRASEHNDIAIVDADGVFVLKVDYVCFDSLGNTKTIARRAELIHHLNGYGEAVDALRDILTVAKGIDRDSREMLYVGKLAVVFTHSTLKQLGELNGDDRDKNSALRDDNSISPEKHRCARKGIGETPGGAGDTCEETREDDGGESVCAFGVCDDPVGVDPQYCPFHEKMIHDTQEADHGK